VIPVIETVRGPEQQWSIAMSQWSFSIPTLGGHWTTGNLVLQLARRLSTLQSHLAATSRLWIARSRQRRDLAELAEWDDYLLKDIGVSREAALREATKPFWRK
jgi:uncharacterized protein YjiS (DUF1127 family)